VKKSYPVLLAAVVASAVCGCGKNEPPVIESLAPASDADTLVTAGDTVSIFCDASDADGDTLVYEWEAIDGGAFLGSQDSSWVFWLAPDTAGDYRIACTVSNGDTLDTINIVHDTLTLEVQNYFPLAKGDWWYYEGFVWLIVNVSASLKKTVYSREELGGGEVYWHIESTFTYPSRDTTDSALYYKVMGDSVWEYVRDSMKLLLVMPLWEDKTWEYTDGAQAEVIEILDRGTEAFSFTDCVHIEIENPADSVTRTVWLAPDVGIIEDKKKVKDVVVYEFELMDYGEAP